MKSQSRSNPVAKYMNSLNKPSFIPHKHQQQFEKELDIEIESAKLDLLRYGCVDEETDIHLGDIGCSNLGIDD